MKKKVLLIDQFDGVRTVLQEHLLDAGYQVVGTKDVSTLQETISSFGPDLVILDFFMNNHERWDILENIKQGFPNLPLVIYTGISSYAQDPRMELADGFVVKSVIFDEIKETVVTMIHGKSLSL